MTQQTQKAQQTVTGSFTVGSWDEREVTDAARSPRLAHAAVVNTFTGGIEARDTACEYALVYVGETRGVFSGMEVLTGSVEGREGSFALRHSGSFDDSGTISCTFEVVPGSATGDLAGLAGTGSYETRPGDQSVPVTFTYELG
ncbi:MULTISPECIES: DUF3224 domain-containing protein [unclassified Streptomyces]|uniref:DUF3224 domain-containing protein n=1 Tax=unclassified Streptomyces TaxID=2593676 RepID=UPI002E15303A|nr:DUF3224 domain-containing protein [Streptomyces sp. NBC_01186]WSS43092.1 DUF3224 domain-containing protein [Streptomyces sp. NBC_01187]